MEKTPKFRPQLALEAGSGLRLLQRYLIVILIPLWMILACQAPSGALFPLPRLPGSWSTLWEPKAFLIVLAWCLLQAGLYLLPLGKVGEGPPMPNGVKLKYNLNGVQAFIITTGLMAYLWYAGVNLAYVYQHYLQLMIAAYTIGLIFCFLLYVKSFAAPIEELVPNANTGNVFVDFYLGRELSPRIGRLNLKFLLMLRIAFLSWVPLNICLLAVASTRWGTPPLPFFLVAIFQILYIFDMMWTEAGEMNTRESTSTGLGYITACGDFAIVPFAYPIQNYFLLHHPQGITVQATIYTILIFIFGFVMYVHSNDQKRSFCKDPNSPKFAGFHKIQTKMGNYLLASGWWGWVRHPHYLGDIIVTMAWSLPCGLSYIVPHLYLFLCIFTLVNRAKVVEQDCHRKYGAAWEEYCRRVKYRFVPFIY